MKKYTRIDGLPSWMANLHQLWRCFLIQGLQGQAKVKRPVSQIALRSQAIHTGFTLKTRNIIIILGKRLLTICIGR